jgi:hypothetical protein
VTPKRSKFCNFGKLGGNEFIVIRCVLLYTIRRNNSCACVQYVHFRIEWTLPHNLSVDEIIDLVIVVLFLSDSQSNTFPQTVSRLVEVMHVRIKQSLCGGASTFYLCFSIPFISFVVFHCFASSNDLVAIKCHNFFAACFTFFHNLCSSIQSIILFLLLQMIFILACIGSFCTIRIPFL